jgi:hypothetical protein
MSGPFGSTTWMSNPSTEFFGHEITNSCRFNDNDSAYLNITPSSAGNVDTWTFSAWVKVGNTVNGPQGIFYASTGIETNSNSTVIYFNDGGILKIRQVNSDSQTVSVASNAVFRDPSAWYHIVVACDTTQGTDTNRIKLYVNGVQITSLSSTTYPSQNADTFINSANIHVIGKYPASGNYYWDGYMAEVNLIDGLQLTPSSFGEFKNDIWIPKDTSGLTFGDEGFRLEFKQSGVGTAGTSTIGADTSGNTNHLTSSGLAVNDQVPDSPTNNFSTLNPLMNDPSYLVTLSEGNLHAAQTNKYFSGCSSFVMSKAIGGKWYFEASSITDGNFPIISVVQLVTTTSPTLANGAGLAPQRYAYHGYDGARRSPSNSGVGTLDGSGSYRSESGWGSTFNQDIMSVALDMDNMKVWFAKNGTYQGSGDPAGDANSAFSSLDDEDYVFWLEDGAGADNRDSTWIANFGQDSSFAGTETAQGNADANGIGDFYYAPPSGFLALCTANLPDPVTAIDPAKGGSPQDFFNTIIWSGTGSSNALDVGFQPDFTWIKRRNGTQSHNLENSVIGATKFLISNTTAAEQTDSSILASFDTNGITVGDNSWSNASGGTYVGWNWKAGTAFSNDASATGVGSIDSAGSVNTDVGFGIISYTGNGSNGATVAHGLGVSPDMIIAKTRDSAENWQVFHSALGGTKRLYFNLTNGEADTAEAWNDTNPSATVITLGTSSLINKDDDKYIAYCFADVEGYSKFGTYIGDASGNGPFIYTGFRPAFTIIKRVNDDGESWIMQDSARSPDNRVIIESEANNSAGESSSDASTGYRITYMANGIKIKNTNVNWNAASGVYIYMCFAEQPFKYANAR